MVTPYEGIPGPELAQPLVDRPHFVLLFDDREATKVTLDGIYRGMSADPEGHLASLGCFAEKPYERPIGFDWFPLMERGRDSFPLYLAFQFDEDTTRTIEADELYQELLDQREGDPDDRIRKIRVRAFEIFLDELKKRKQRIVRSAGGVSLDAAA